MKQLTKQQQKAEAEEEYNAIVDPAWTAYCAIADPAYKAYAAIVDPALEAYEAKIKEIYAQADKVEQIITYDGRQYKLIGERNDR